MVEAITQLNLKFQEIITPASTLVNTLLVIYGIVAVIGISTPDNVFQGAKEKGKSAFIWIGIGTIALKVVLSMN